MATRREFLGRAAAALACGGISTSTAGAAQPVLIAAARVQGRDGGVLWRPDGLTSFGLPGRGHALSRRSGSDDIVVVGRRPGTFAAIVSAVDVEKPPCLIEPARDCRFAGHAAMAPDGASMVTSEFDAQTMQGVLVLRDPASGKERGRWSPNGIEPHELLFAKNGARLVVALGGLVKDGGVAGPVFNEGGIESAVVEIDPSSGAILARHKLPADFASLSLRHLARTPDGETVVIGVQDQDLSTPRPLVGVLSLGGGIDLLPLPDVSDCDFRGYVGSVAISGDCIAATSPRGGVVGVWSLRNRKWIGGLQIPDVCGLGAAGDNGAFWITSGFGDVVRFVVTATGPVIEAKWRVDASFDNHLLRM